MSRFTRYARWRKTLDQRADRTRRFRTAPPTIVETRSNPEADVELPDSIWMMSIVWDGEDEVAAAQTDRSDQRRQVSA